MKTVKNIVSVTMCVTAVVLFSGCAHQVSPYSPSFANIETLQHLKKNAQPIKLGEFSDPRRVRSITCRLEGSENLPGNVTYVEYIKNALQEDLTHVGLYSNAANNVLDANLDRIDANSMIGNGSWTIQMTFNDHQKAPYIVHSVYKFSTNYVADIACTQVAQAFVPAMQKFLQTLYQNKDFIKTISRKGTE